MTSGEIVWGVNSTFISYVRRSGGLVELEEGAWADEEDRFHFPLASGADHSADLVVSTGRVRISAHEGLLSLTLADPQLQRRTGRIVLTARLQDESEERTEIAEVRPHARDDWGSASHWRDVETRLTAAGADAIGPLHYFAGQRVDGIDLVIPVPGAEPARAS